MSRLLYITGILLFAAIANAQTSITVDINKAQLSWMWEQGLGGTVDSFNMKCGATSGQYTKITPIINPLARSIPVLQAITGVGSWFCVVSAQNTFGESSNSNEVNFVAGTVPIAPVLNITAQ